MNNNNIYKQDYGKVSVVIPTYNRSSELANTLQCVLNQTYSDLEVLICDDGSTDNTKDVVNEIIIRDSRVKYIDCGHNGRPAIPRNFGIQNATGEWLAFLDDDDAWIINKLESQLTALNRTHFKACCTNAYKVFEDKLNSGEAYFKVGKDRKYTYKDFNLVNRVICSSMLIHRSLIDECYGFPEDNSLRAIEDYALWNRISIYTKIYYISTPLVLYTMSNPTSVRKTNQISFKEVKSRVDNNFINWIANKPVQIKNRYRRELCFAGLIKPLLKLKWKLNRVFK